MTDTSPRKTPTATVGIIVPTYNYGRFLDDCLGSVAAQTYTDFTVLVIDNASVDDTQAVVERWVARDPRIRYVRNDVNIGLGNSLLKAYGLLNTPLMMVLSADDYLRPAYLEHTAGALARHPQCVMAYSAWEIVFDIPGDPRHGQFTRYYIPNHETGVVDDTPVLLTQNWITNSICLWRRAVCDVVGALDNEKLTHVGDWHLYLRLMSEGPAYYVNDPLGVYRIHGNAESDRLRKDGLSAPDHIRIYDLISTAERWPMSVRYLAKAHQIRWLTGEPLMSIVQRLGNAGAHPIIREMLTPAVRREMLIGAARAVLEYTPAPNTLDAADKALEAIDQVLAEAPDHPGALALRARHGTRPGTTRIVHDPEHVLAARLRRHIAAELACQPPAIGLTVIVDARGSRPLRRTLRSLKHQDLAPTHIVLLGAPSAPAEAACTRLDAADLPDWLATHCHDPAHWVLGLVAGDTLAEDALYHCARAIARQPEARIVYTDHDEIGRDDLPAHPHHKPDANLELLRSTPYLGRAILVRGDLLADHPPPLDLVASHALALAAVRAGGIAALAHVPALLMHLDARCAITRPDTPEQSAALGSLVHTHAALSAPGTTVIDGPEDGQFAWLPPLHRQPRVSIIIPTKDQLPLLSRCLDTLLGETRYSSFEVIVVDNDSADADTRAYLAAFEAGRDPRVRVLRHPGPFNFSAMNNRAAEIASGDYLLLLNNDTEVIEPDWLGVMMRHAQDETVGVVGPMLYFPNGCIQHAGVVIGLNGPADHPFIDAPADAAGYLQRTRLHQDYSAVTGACLLTRKSLYQQLGGLDETRFAVSYNDIDYCLRVREAGKRVLWTPLARMQHVGSASQRSNTEAAAQAQKVIRFSAEQRAMYQRWGAWIARDPAYNCNLSLRHTDVVPESEPLLRFDPLAGAGDQRILALPASAARSRYRIFEPLAALLAGQHASGGALRAPLAPHLALRSGADTLLLQLPREQAQILTLQTLQALPGITTVLDGDDLLRDNPYIDLSQPDPLAQIPAALRSVLDGFDRIVVSNPRLADRLNGLTAPVVVVPDALHPGLWSAPPRNTPATAPGKRPRIGWLTEREADAAVLIEVVSALTAEAEFFCIGPCPEALHGVVRQIDITDGADYPRTLAALDWDIALAPLPDT
ncbi:MAG: glycosyltransferase, partial [Rhodocyclaceae bacterium]|nr:glycosyltransferase [Rhodocyclaceae bacterium]